MNLSRDEQLALLSLKQPDSLKLTARLAILKWFHAIATQIEERFGDKAADKKLFLPGVQVSTIWSSLPDTLRHINAYLTS